MKIFLCLLLILIGELTVGAQSAVPELTFRGSEPIEMPGGKRTLYRLGVSNRLAYPDELFEAAPDLPPCGRNQKAARSWVNIYSTSGERIYGFCALKSAAELDALAFTYPVGKIPGEIYIVIWDRKTGIEYKSNAVEVE